MKNRRLLPLLASASLFSALGLSLTASPAPAQAQAQPDTTPKMGKKGGVRAKGARGKMPKRMLEKLETQLGKPLTEEQKTRLNTAYKARMDAQKAAQATFADEVAAVTGLTADQVKALNKRGPGAGGMMGKRKPA